MPSVEHLCVTNPICIYLLVKSTELARLALSSLLVMTRSSNNAARKERGEERNKAKWMREAQRNRKRAEDAELRIVTLEQQIAASSTLRQEPTHPSSTFTDVVKSEELPVSRTEFDAVRSELERLRLDYAKVMDVNKLLSNEHSALQGELELVKEKAKQLEASLTKARSAELIARSLYKRTVEKFKKLDERSPERDGGGATLLHSTPRTSPDILASQPAVRHLSPITPERLDFRDSSPGAMGISCATRTAMSRKRKPLWRSIVDLFSDWIRRMFGLIFSVDNQSM